MGSAEGLRTGLLGSPHGTELAERSGSVRQPGQQTADGPVGSSRIESEQRWWRRGRRALSYFFFAFAYCCGLYMFMGSQRKEDGWSDLSSYHWCIAGIILSLLGFALLVAYQYYRGELELMEDHGVPDMHRRVKWSRLFGYGWSLLIVMIILTLPIFLSLLGKGKPQNIGLIVAGVFSIIAIVLGMREIWQHWKNYHKPRLQKHIARVLFMVPIYTIDAYVTLVACASTSNILRRPDGSPCPGAIGNPDDGSSNGTLDGWLSYDLQLDDDSSQADTYNKILDSEGSCYDNVLVLILSILREVYEAYTLYSFFTYLTLQLHEIALHKEAEQREQELAKEEELRLEQMQKINALPREEREAARRQHDERQAADYRRMAAMNQSMESDAGDEGMLENAYREKAYYNDDVSLSSGNLPLEEDDTDGRISFRVISSPRRSHRIEVMDHAIGMHNPSALYALLESLGPQPHTLLTCGLRPGVGAPWPPPWEPGEKWLHKCRVGVLQYMALEVFMAIVIALARWRGVYGEQDGVWPWIPDAHGRQRAYPWTTFIISCSQMWALYCLIHFYHVTRELLEPIQPLLKFVSIKMIVFFTFWQSVAINVLHGLDFFENFNLECNFGIPEMSFTAGLQACLICIEMFLASCVHRSVFTYKAFRKKVGPLGTVRPPLALCAAVKDTFNNSDVTDQLQAFVTGVPKDAMSGAKKVVAGVADGVNDVVTTVVDEVDNAGTSVKKSVEDTFGAGSRKVDPDVFPERWG